MTAQRYKAVLLKNMVNSYVYFGIETDVVVILLCGGDKGSQLKDIKQAKAYWADLKDHCHE